jgi:Kef-type K+ transport system membrane component KefB
MLFDLALIIVLARAFGALACRVGQPNVIGEAVAGMLVRPALLSALANAGVAIFMLPVGIESDDTLLRGRGRVSVSGSVSGGQAAAIAGGSA